MEGMDWYQGTADAVRKQLRYIEQPGIDFVLILSGDQLYRMDYKQMLKTHKKSGADVSIAALPVDREAAKAFGIMRIDDSGRVVGFLEKPQTQDEYDIVRTDPAWLDEHGVNSRGRDCLASMGIYLFNRDTLVELLRKSDYQDFGKEVFPMSIRARHVQMYPFDGYWEDIGTIRSFYQANLELASKSPPFEFESDVSPIYTRPRFLPPARIAGATITNSVIADGCFIEEGSVIENSVVGLRCRIGRNVTIRNSVLMGADLYESDGQRDKLAAAGKPALGIGNGSYVEGAILDKNCRVGANVRVHVPAESAADADLNGVFIRDGIVIVPKDAQLPDGWKL
jgi:glucose-1-phosphate adenylyltransferase